MRQPNRPTSRHHSPQRGVEVIVESEPDLKRQAQALLIVLGFGRERSDTSPSVFAADRIADEPEQLGAEFQGDRPAHGGESSDEQA